jgi:hypothetical protein
MTFSTMTLSLTMKNATQLNYIHHKDTRHDDMKHSNSKRVTLGIMTFSITIRRFNAIVLCDTFNAVSLG